MTEFALILRALHAWSPPRPVIDVSRIIRVKTPLTYSPSSVPMPFPSCPQSVSAR